jgi:hypothetical protein
MIFVKGDFVTANPNPARLVFVPRQYVPCRYVNERNAAQVRHLRDRKCMTYKYFTGITQDQETLGDDLIKGLER